ncbi:MAG: hypothetical protein KJ706_09065 [Candidatus Omnitrophica bacterium]|nr:hypothetical protein [Candidatus Omnitrophota bacterium]MBU4590435.1 hypothetical protein [Candidatus Omnitrophota bacterium]
MVKENRILIFIIGFLCAWTFFSNFTGETKAQSALPSNITFSGESNVIYFLDRDNGIVYRYNTQGRFTRSYIIEELGKDLKSK